MEELRRAKPSLEDSILQRLAAPLEAHANGSNPKGGAKRLRDQPALQQPRPQQKPRDQPLLQQQPRAQQMPRDQPALQQPRPKPRGPGAGPSNNKLLQAEISLAFLLAPRTSHRTRCLNDLSFDGCRGHRPDREGACPYLHGSSIALKNLPEPVQLFLVSRGGTAGMAKRLPPFRRAELMRDLRLKIQAKLKGFLWEVAQRVQDVATLSPEVQQLMRQHGVWQPASAASGEKLVITIKNDLAKRGAQAQQQGLVLDDGMDLELELGDPFEDDEGQDPYRQEGMPPSPESTLPSRYAPSPAPEGLPVSSSLNTLQPVAPAPLSAHALLKLGAGLGGLAACPSGLLESPDCTDRDGQPTHAGHPPSPNAGGFEFARLPDDPPTHTTSVPATEPSRERGEREREREREARRGKRVSPDRGGPQPPAQPQRGPTATASGAPRGASLGRGLSRARSRSRSDSRGRGKGRERRMRGRSRSPGKGGARERGHARRSRDRSRSRSAGRALKRPRARSRSPTSPARRAGGRSEEEMKKDLQELQELRQQKAKWKHQETILDQALAAMTQALEAEKTRAAAQASELQAKVEESEQLILDMQQRAHEAEARLEGEREKREEAQAALERAEEKRRRLSEQLDKELKARMALEAAAKDKTKDQEKGRDRDKRAAAELAREAAAWRAVERSLDSILEDSTRALRRTLRTLRDRLDKFVEPGGRGPDGRWDLGIYSRRGAEVKGAGGAGMGAHARVVIKQEDGEGEQVGRASSSTGASAGQKERDRDPGEGMHGRKVDRLLRELRAHLADMRRYVSTVSKQCDALTPLAGPQEGNAAAKVGATTDEPRAETGQPLEGPDDRGPTASSSVWTEAGDEEYCKKSYLLNSYLNSRKEHPKGPKAGQMIMRVNREEACDSLLARIKQVKGQSMFKPFRIRFNGEDLNDDGGGLMEIYTLSFQQLRELRRRVVVDGEEEDEEEGQEVRLFDASPGGVLLPFKPPTERLRVAMEQSEEVATAYRMVGRVLHKAVIDRASVPSALASHLMMSFILHEDPQHAGNVPLADLALMWEEIEPDQKWFGRLVRAPDQEKMTVEHVLQNDDHTLITSHNVSQVLRCFFEIKVCEGRRWQLGLIREGFADCGETLLPAFLAIFKRQERRRFISGEEGVDSARILSILEFEGAVIFDEPRRMEQRRAVEEAIRMLTPAECLLFLRAATSRTSLTPEETRIRMYIEGGTQGSYPVYSTCFATVTIPDVDYTAEQLVEKLRFSFHPAHLVFAEPKVV